MRGEPGSWLESLSPDASKLPPASEASTSKRRALSLAFAQTGEETREGAGGPGKPHRLMMPISICHAAVEWLQNLLLAVLQCSQLPQRAIT